MTCIVGVVENGEVWLGADSGGIASSTWLHVTRRDPKLFRLGEMLIGYTSSFRMAQLIRFSLQPPAIPREIDPFEGLCTVFVPALRKCLAEGGFAKKENNVEHGGTFLVAFRGRLFEIEDDFQVGETVHGYAAVGCGQQVALGSLATTDGLGRPGSPWMPGVRVEQALRAAERHNIGVRGPFRVERSS